MLNASRLLQFIKTEIGFPWQFIEMTDEEILDHVTKYTLRTFAQYFPDIITIGYNLGATANKVPNKANEFYLYDADNREILSIVHVYFPLGNYVMFGHPPIGPLSFGELQQWALDVEMAGWVKSFSSWNYTVVFNHPNIFSIRPTPKDDVVAIEYERQHAVDFSTVPNGFQMYFLELALADIMMLIGRIRKKYGDGGLKTPFGDINLSTDIYEEGKEKRAEVIEKLSNGSIPNVVISFG
jgi:hypothetical protein